ncbi:hypothetical protein BDZ89DRAFT_1076917 [Hymenopellis radicata]|nr:hypothetical protein BDZ89DRAFT_1076917 [Hymenopellis radicata]
MDGQEHESRGPRHVGGTTSLDVLDWWRMGEVLPKKGTLLRSTRAMLRLAHLLHEMRNVLRVLQRALNVGINGGGQNESFQEGCHERCWL